MSNKFIEITGGNINIDLLKDCTPNAKETFNYGKGECLGGITICLMR